MKAPILILLSSLAMAASANVYVYTDKDGNQVFTDAPPEGQAVEQVEVPPTNTLNTPPDQTEKNEEFFKQLGQQQQQQEDDRNALRQQKNAAKKALEEAQAQLEKAKVIRSGDIYPNRNGGVRYTEQYSNRVEAARQALNQAQAAYDDINQ